MADLHLFTPLTSVSATYDDYYCTCDGGDWGYQCANPVYEGTRVDEETFNLQNLLVELTGTWTEDLELFARNTLRLHEPAAFSVEVEPWHVDKPDLQVYLEDPEAVHKGLKHFLGR